MRPIKEKFVINIKVTPDKAWSRCRLESDAGDVEYKSYARENAQVIIAAIRNRIVQFLEHELPEAEEELMMEISCEEFDEDPEYKEFTKMVKEVDISWKE